ncbi:MAG: isochorismatase family cysteine hydrolase [Thiohalobacteraceae bacterium]
MTKPDSDMDGNAPDSCKLALLLIDVINDLEFSGGDALLTQALPAAERIADLKRRARTAGIPAVYVNDNFGRWRSDFRQTVAHCRNPAVRGHPLAERLEPAADDYFVLKPKHSGFQSTVLDMLLEHLGASRLILTGFRSDSCVLFTAADAHMRNWQVLVPADCTAARTTEEHRHALALLQHSLGIDIRPSTALDLNALLQD